MLTKIPFDRCADIIKRFELGERATKLLTSDLSPQVAIEKLNDAGEVPDLINFIGHALPAREGICWALSVSQDLNPELYSPLLNLVKAWVQDPQEDVRRNLMKHLDQLKSDSPIYWLCAAVAWSGMGGIGAEEGPTVLPPPWLHAKALLGALALQMGEDEESIDRARIAILQRGLEVARGGWPCMG